jgi:small subunit ribosomal protein S2
MLGAGMHYGHRSSRWHPKMEPYIFAERNGIHIINLEKTAALFAKALDFMRDTVANGGVVMLVGTKEQASAVVERAGLETGMPYVNRRWLGGTLTNFRMLKDNLLGKYLDIKGKLERGELGKYTKLEQLEFSKKTADMNKKIGGISSLTKLPEAIFILDIRKEVTAFTEAKDTKVPIVAICDSNVNPDGVAYPIPSNDDSVKTIELVFALVTEAIKEGKRLHEQNILAAAAVAPAVQA